MSTRTKTTRPKARPGAGPSLAEEGPPAAVKLMRVALRALSYEEVRHAAAPLPPGQTEIQVTLTLGGKVLVKPGFGEVRLQATVTPDPTYQPLEVKVLVSAFFGRVEQISDEDFKKFLKGPAVRMLFPYVRELVSSTSARGMFPPVWLDPITLRMAQDPPQLTMNDEGRE